MLGEILQTLLRWFGEPIVVFEVLALTAYALLIGAEAGYGRRSRRKLYDRDETRLNGVLYAGNFAINALWVYGIYLAYKFAFDHRIANVSSGLWHPAGLWRDLLLLWVLDDFVFYWFHRSSHRVRFLWASHITHHTSTYFNLSAAFRQTWLPFVALPFWMVLPWIGFDPLMVMSMTLFNLFWQTALHTQVVPKLGPIEWIFNTPSHHRVHHGANEPYRDRNFGGVLIIWDRLFGTFQAEDEKIPVRYGLTENIRSFNPLAHAFGEMRAWLRDLKQARSLREFLGYSFAPPGWLSKSNELNIDARPSE